MDEKEFDSVGSLSDYLHKQKEQNAQADRNNQAPPHNPVRKADNSPLFLMKNIEKNKPERVQEYKPENSYPQTAPDSETSSLESVTSIIASINKHKTDQLEGKLIVQEPEGSTQMIDAVRPQKIHSTLDKLDVKKGAGDATQMIDAIKDTERAVRNHNSDVIKERKRRAAIRRKRDIEELKRLKKSRLRKRTLWHIAGGVILSLSIILISVFLAYYVVRGALDFMGLSEENYTIQIEIPEDAEIGEIASILKSNGIISMPELFTFYAGFKDESELVFREGKHTLGTNMTYSSILDTLTTKTSVKETVSVFIQEGMTALEIAQLLEENHVCRQEDFIANYKSLMHYYNYDTRLEYEAKKFNQMEGYLFPDTYEFYVIEELKTKYKPETEEEAKKMEEKMTEAAMEAAKKMYSNFNSKITVAMYKKMGELGLDLDETITLASMVQREASSAEDMKLVASTFLNRLNNPELFPKLESDVTIIYIEENIKSQMTQSEINRNSSIISAYNTYDGKGLPPGAICNPGLDAIKAVLNAPETDYFYFCANEKTGEVFYAATLAEHENNLVLAELV